MRRLLAGLLASIYMAAPASAEVPIAIAATGHATVPVEVEGHGTVPFVFDTGAEGSAIYAPVAAAWGLVPKTEGTELVGQTGSTRIDLVALPAVRVDGVSAGGLDAAVLPARADGAPLDGIIGLDLIGGGIVDFDLPGSRLSLLPAGTDVAARAGRSLRPVAAQALASGILAVPVTVGGVEAVAVIDTGARKTRINGRLARMLGLSAATPGFVAGEPIFGATNDRVETLSGTLGGVALGGQRLDSAPVLVADLPVFEVFGIADRPAIILGLDWLTGLRMLVDFPRRQVWFAAAAGGEGT